MAFVASQAMFEDRESMLQRVTEFEWPAGTTQVFLVDEEKPEDNPYYIEAHVRVPVDAVDRVLADGRWQPAEPSAIDNIPEASRLPPGLQAPTTDEVWLARGSADGATPYTMLLEQETGRVWMHVDVQ